MNNVLKYSLNFIRSSNSFIYNFFICLIEKLGRPLFKFICSKHGLYYYTDQESEHSNYNQTESMMIVMMQCVNVCVNCTQRNWRERTISISLRHVNFCILFLIGFQKTFMCFWVFLFISDFHTSPFSWCTIL